MLTLLRQQPKPSADEIEILLSIIDQFGLDIAAVWALIDAFNYGLITGKRLERCK